MSRSPPRITIRPGARFGSSSHSFPLKNLPRAAVFTRGAESREQVVIRDIALRAITALCLHTRNEIQHFFNFNVSEMVEFRQESFTVGQSLAHRYLLWQATVQIIAEISLPAFLSRALCTPEY
jgi:hypothetical protein